MFYVAMSPKQPNAAYAACISDDKQIVREFYRKHVGAEIRLVDGTTMRDLLDNYRRDARSCISSLTELKTS